MAAAPHPPPPSTPALGPWRAVGLTLLAVAGTRIAFLTLAQLLAWLHDVRADEVGQALAAQPAALGLVQGVGLGGALWLGLGPAARRAPLPSLGLSTVPAHWLLLAFAGGLALQLPLAELGNVGRLLWPESDAALRQLRRLLAPGGAGRFVTLLVSLAVVVPLLEEVFFRGLLLGGLRRGGMRWAAAWLLSSLLFGLAHVTPAAVLYATVAGLLLGALVLRTGSTTVSFAAHAGVNALPVLLPARAVPIPGFNDFGAKAAHVPWPWWVAGSLVAALCFGALWWSSGSASGPATGQERPS